MKHNVLLKEFLKYASLNVLGMIGLSCYILADTFFVAKGLGANGLAALNIAIPVYSFLHGSGLLLGMGGATKYAIFKSQGKQENANQYFTNTIRIASGFACVFVLLGLFGSAMITAIFGADDVIFSMTHTYLKVILLFAPCFLLNDIMICFVRNDGNPKLAMLAMLGGSLSNVILDYIFIFPFQMGIFGAVFATGLAPILSLLILSRHWLRSEKGFHFVKTRLVWIQLRSILLLGFPSLITEVASGIVMIAFNSILLTLAGNVGVAAYGVIANLSLVVIAIYTGIAQGTQPLLSKAYGEKNQMGIQTILRYAMISIGILSIGMYASIFFLADPITALFNSEQNLQLQEIASSGLKIYFTAIGFVGFHILISIFFTSTEHALPAHIISMLRGCVIMLPMAFLLSSLLGLLGVWLAFPISEGIVCFLSIPLYLHSKNKLYRA